MKFVSIANLYTLALIAAHTYNSSAYGIRGGSNSGFVKDVVDQDHRSGHGRELETVYKYKNLRLCGQTLNDADHDKYFWMSVVDNDKNVKGSCLLEIPDGTDSGTLQCCTIGGVTEYKSTWNLAITDPITITDESNPAYSLCGADGGSECSSYSYSNNKMGFSKFDVLKKSSSGDVYTIREMDKFVYKEYNTDSENGGCGLGDELGTCGDGVYDVYSHVHMGDGTCLQAGVTFKHYCDSHYGYKCKDPDC